MPRLERPAITNAMMRAGRDAVQGSPLRSDHVLRTRLARVPLRISTDCDHEGRDLDLVDVRRGSLALTRWPLSGWPMGDARAACPVVSQRCWTKGTNRTSVGPILETDLGPVVVPDRVALGGPAGAVPQVFAEDTATELRVRAGRGPSRRRRASSPSRATKDMKQHNSGFDRIRFCDARARRAHRHD